jgi:hypothetical protein
MHAVGKCGLLGTFNKIHDTAGYTPIALISPSIITDANSKPVTLEGLSKKVTKEKKEVRGELKKLDTRVTALEPKRKRKEQQQQSGTNATDSSSSRPSKRSKKNKDKAKATPAPSAMTTTAPLSKEGTSGTKKEKGKGKQKQTSGGASSSTN